MPFNSVPFLLFIVAFFLLWPLFRRSNHSRLIYLSVASFVFYSMGSLRMVLLLLVVNLLNYGIGRAIEKAENGKARLVWLGVAANLLILLSLKYSLFLTSNLQTMLDFLHIQTRITIDLSNTNQIGTLGISFYTLQAVSYLVDVYHGRILAVRNLFKFIAFLSMFPKLIAGPVERSAALLPQLDELPEVDEASRWEGTKLIIQGYFLKLFLADNLGAYVRLAFDDPYLPSRVTLYWWLIVTAFAFQLYFDFFGYSQIARGLGKWIGINLMVNFDHPYISTSFAEFWKRWHIAVSNWLRDYIFIPLGRSKFSRGRHHLNMFITMLASGFWHGVGWTFILWGFLHGVYISVERLTHWPQRLNAYRWGPPVAVLVVIVQTWIAWVFFRARNIVQALQILRSMLIPQGGEVPIPDQLLLFILISFLVEIIMIIKHPIILTNIIDKYPVLEPTFYASLFAIAIFFRGQLATFVYFQV